MFLKKQDAGKNNQWAPKGAQCKTRGCTCTANADSGYCFACEIAWEQFGREVSNWYAVRDAAEAVESGWARR